MYGRLIDEGGKTALHWLLERSGGFSIERKVLGNCGLIGAIDTLFELIRDFELSRRYRRPDAPASPHPLIRVLTVSRSSLHDGTPRVRTPTARELPRPRSAR